MPTAAFDFGYNVDKDGNYHQDAPIKYIKAGEEIPAGILERLRRFNPEHIIEDDTGEEAKKEPEPKVTEKKFTEKEVKDMRKDEQVELLEQYGLSADDIKTLRYEKDRVKKILELQK